MSNNDEKNNGQERAAHSFGRAPKKAMKRLPPDRFAQMSPAELDRLMKLAKQSQQNRPSDLDHIGEPPMIPPVEEYPEKRPQPPLPSRRPGPAVSPLPKPAPSRDLEIVVSNMQKLLRERDVQLRNQDSEIVSLKKQIEELQKLAASAGESEELKELLMKIQEEKRTVESAYDGLKHKMDTSYTSDDLARYFSHAIDSFNDRMNSDIVAEENEDLQSAVGYIINEMDVDLKAQIVKDSKSDSLLFLTDPEASGSDAMSTVRISIKAFPKGVPADSKGR